MDPDSGVLPSPGLSSRTEGAHTIAALRGRHDRHPHSAVRSWARGYCLA